MSLKKPTPIPGGYTAEFWSINFYERLDYSAKKAVIIFSLWRDQAAYEAKETPLERAGRLVLEGDKFDEYLAKEVLKTSERDINAQIYAAAKVEPVDFWFARASDFLADAVDV